MPTITRNMLEELESYNLYSIDNLRTCPASTLCNLSADSLFWLLDRTEKLLASSYHKRNYPEIYNDFLTVQLPRIQTAIQLQTKES